MLAAGGTFTMADVRMGRVRYEANTERVSVRSANDTLRLAVRDKELHAAAGGPLVITVALDELLAWFYPLRNRRPGTVLDVQTRRTLTKRRSAAALFFLLLVFCFWSGKRAFLEL